MMVGGSQYGGHHHQTDLADLSFTLSERDRHHSTVSLLDSIERRTQRTYRYGIGLVCIGATLNWLGFAQGNSYIDPLRYLGVACVISGSFCVCLAMCRWLGRPISLSGHRVSGLEEDSLSSRVSGDVHVINVAVPMYMPSMHEEYRPQKPPDYEIVAGEPPPYDEAIKLTPGALFPQHSHPDYVNENAGHPVYETGSLYQPPASCAPSPSHSANSTSALLIQSEGRKAEVTQRSPPPPYHPNPSRYPPSSQGVPLNSISQNSSNKYHMSAEQEHLLGMMMRGTISEELGDVTPTPSDQVTSGTNERILEASTENTNQLLNYQNTNLHLPVILTDGNGNNPPSILIDSQPNPFLN